MKNKLLEIAVVIIVVTLAGAAGFVVISSFNNKVEFNPEPSVQSDISSVNVLPNNEQNIEVELDFEEEAEVQQTIERSTLEKVVDKVKDVIPTPKEKPTTIDTTTSESDKTQRIMYDVPFTSQAPLGDWDDPRQQDGCEEVASLMAMKWVNGESLTASEALDEIIAISQYEETNWGSYEDTSAEDTVIRIFNGYFGYENVQIVYDFDVQTIIDFLYSGNLVIVPLQGQRLYNPYFTPPGPPTHMLVIKGYDPATKEFITNEPGTRRGESYRYGQNVIFNAILNYPTGYHENADNAGRAIIIVHPKK